MSVGKEERCYKGRRRVLTPRKSLIVTAALSIKACASSVLACSSCASQSLSCRRYEAGFFRPRNFVTTARAVCRDRIQHFETAFWKRRFRPYLGTQGLPQGKGKKEAVSLPPQSPVAQLGILTISLEVVNPLEEGV